MKFQSSNLFKGKYFLFFFRGTAMKIIVSYYNNLTWDELADAIRRIYKKRRNAYPNLNQRGEWDCMETSFSYDKRPQIRVGGRKLYCAVLVCLHKYRMEEPFYNIPQEFEASHFWCHNQHCVNADHLCFEDGITNKSRLYCKTFRTNPHHACLHYPECKLY